jgi:hypothetical protein
MTRVRFCFPSPGRSRMCTAESTGRSTRFRATKRTASGTSEPGTHQKLRRAAAKTARTRTTKASGNSYPGTHQRSRRVAPRTLRHLTTKARRCPALSAVAVFARR